jgi:uncharacterized caspase-like protein
LAAATPLQEAVSSKALQHGLLTTVLLEALNGVAASARESSIRIRTVADRVADNVPKRAREQGWAQTALVTSVGVDFPISAR